MNWLTEALRRLGVLPSFTVDDMINAESEDALVDHRRVLEELTAATTVRRQATIKLRDTLREARLRSVTFADFEQNIRPPLTTDLKGE
jgi:hypothetical protein